METSEHKLNFDTIRQHIRYISVENATYADAKILSIQTPFAQISGLHVCTVLVFNLEQAVYIKDYF